MEDRYSPAVWTAAQEEEWNQLDQQGKHSADEIFAMVFRYRRNRSAVDVSVVDSVSDPVAESGTVTTSGPRIPIQRRPRRGYDGRPEPATERSVGLGEEPEHCQRPDWDSEQRKRNKRQFQLARDVVKGNVLWV